MIGLASYLTSTFYDKKKAVKTVQLEYVNEQVSMNSSYEY